MVIPVQRKMLLVIEDDYESAKNLAECLPEFEVHRAHTLREATDKLFSRGRKQQKFSGIIVDLNLPDGDGAVLAQKAHEVWPDLAIVVVTGMSDEDVDTVVVRRAGVHRIVKKPIDIDELRDALLDAMAEKKCKEQTEKIMQSLSEARNAMDTALASAPGRKQVNHVVGQN
jgi:two-component system response regulator HydG